VESQCTGPPTDVETAPRLPVEAGELAMLMLRLTRGINFDVFKPPRTGCKRPPPLFYRTPPAPSRKLGLNSRRLRRGGGLTDAGIDVWPTRLSGRIPGPNRPRPEYPLHPHSPKARPPAPSIETDSPGPALADRRRRYANPLPLRDVAQFAPPIPANRRSIAGPLCGPWETAKMRYFRAKLVQPRPSSPDRGGFWERLSARSRRWKWSTRNTT